MIPDSEIVARLLFSAFLGAIVGAERELNHQPAGLRTHMLLVVGASLAMILSINLGFLFTRAANTADPARLAAQVISGIGFLGAGAILQFGYNVKGLTTSTSLWTMATVGMTVGAGYYLVGAITTVIMLGVLFLLHLLKPKLTKRKTNKSLHIIMSKERGLLQSVQHEVKKEADDILSLSIQHDIKNKRVQYQAVVNFSRDKQIEELLSKISNIEGIIKVIIE